LEPVNDAADHATGDVVLREAARRLRAAVRPGDTVARVGGDEFVLLRLADGTSYGVGVSVGAVLCDATDTPASALARADAAMYRVKAGRRLAANRS
jgi:GGDEF domain-containing protein